MKNIFLSLLILVSMKSLKAQIPLNDTVTNFEVECSESIANKEAKKIFTEVTLNE